MQEGGQFNNPLNKFFSFNNAESLLDLLGMTE